MHVPTGIPIGTPLLRDLSLLLFANVKEFENHPDTENSRNNNSKYIKCFHKNIRNHQSRNLLEKNKTCNTNQGQINHGGMVTE